VPSLQVLLVYFKFISYFIFIRNW